MTSYWNFLPCISIKYNEGFTKLLETAAQSDPFVSLPWLLQSNSAGPSGVLRNNELLIPCKFLSDSCIGLGGYVCSEMQHTTFSIDDAAITDTQLADLPAWLTSKGIHGVFIEADDASAQTRALRDAFKSAQWYLHTTSGSLKPFTVLPPAADFPHFDDLLRSINKKEYRSLRSAKRKLSQHKFHIEQMKGTISDSTIMKCKEIEDASWKAGKGIFATNKLDGTILALKSCETLVSILYINSQAVAWDIDILHNNILYSYNRAYKENFKEYAPGKILHYANIESAWMQGVTHFELLGKADAFKSRFASDTHSRVRMAVFSKHATGRVLSAGYTLYSKVKPYIKKLRADR